MAGVVGASVTIPMLINNCSIEGHAISVYSVPENIKNATVAINDGSATFFYGERGKIYSYNYNYDKSRNKYVSDFTAINSLEYTKSEYARALSINEGMSIKINDVPSDVVKADVYLNIYDSHYSEAEMSVQLIRKKLSILQLKQWFR